ncbi:MAG: helix-turn-helix transcriptional regulator [Pseudoxanthomonas sp.]
MRRQLRAARECAGVTQTALSEALGKSQTFVSDVERGVRRLDVVELWDFCAALGLDLPAFVAEFQREATAIRSKRPKRVRAIPAKRPRRRS